MGGQQMNMQQQQMLYPSSREIEAHLANLYDAYAEVITEGAGYQAIQVPNPRCRFKHILYDPEPDPIRRQMSTCPPFMDRKAWENAENQNPDVDTLVPVPIIGFRGLSGRVQYQMAETEKLQELAERVKERVEGVTVAGRNMRGLVDKLRHQEAQLFHRLLQIMRKIEILRSLNEGLRPDEIRLRERLQQLYHAVSSPKERLHEVAALHVAEERRTEQYDRIDMSEWEHLYRSLERQREGIEELTRISRTDARDLDIIRQKVSERRQNLRG